MANITKKDIVISLFRAIIWSFLFLYTLYLFINKIVIVPGKDWIYNTIIFFIILLLSLVIIIVWLFKICIKKQKIVAFLLWIFLILFAYYSWIVDYPQNWNYVFLRDGLSLLWVIISIIWLTDICFYDKCKELKEKEKEEQMEIIEV